jgi:hypothetical protein
MPKTKVFIASLVIPGNSLPITEVPYLQTALVSQDPAFKKNESQNKHPNQTGFLGKPCHPGYQSHYTVVATRVGYLGLPLDILPTETNYDELVAFETSQILPLFLLYLNSKETKEGENATTASASASASSSSDDLAMNTSGGGGGQNSRLEWMNM